MKKLNLTVYATVFLFLGLLVFTAGCKKDFNPKEIKDFNQVNLVANNNEYNNAFKDSTLINAWGLAFNPGGVAWVNSQAGHVSALYDKEGKTLRPPVAIPSPADTIGGNPTGIVFNGVATDFILSNSKPALFIFVGVDGILSAWNGTISVGGKRAVVIKNNAATASYTGLTLASNNGANYLYAADFRGGKITVWDNAFNKVPMTFKDPNLPSGYSPFNIQVVGGDKLYVEYAKVGSDGRDQAGFGNGYVSIFKTNGDFVKRFASKGTLNAPWGITQAAPGFFADMDDDNDDSSGDGHNKVSDKHGDDDNQPLILVGNFGDGRINVYRQNGDFIGQLKTHNGHIITIPGLWALSFPPATATAIDPNRLYFTAGPDDEKDGLFGYLIKQ